MSLDIKPQQPELFIDLSEKKQETVSGGGSFDISDFFFQKTDIATFANNETRVSDGNRSISSKQQTGYMLSQITMGFSGGGIRRRRSSRSSRSFFNMLFGLMSLFG